MPTEASMLCIINGVTFYLFTKNIWIEDSRAPCHITKDDISLFDIIEFNESIQVSSGSMPVTKKGSSYQGMKSWWYWMVPQYMVNEVFLQGRCEPVFPNMQTFVGKEDLKQPLKQHHGWIFQRRYHLRSLNQDTWWLGSWIYIPTRNIQREGTVCLPSTRKISMTSISSLVIHTNQLPMPLPKPWVSMSLVSSNHVKIASWERTNSMKWAKRM